MRFNNFWRYRRILLSKDFAAAVWHSRRNAIAEARDKPPPAGPYMAELDITYRCNCSCRMCQRWQDKRCGELELEEYYKLAADLHALGSHQISIAGGEPLMRPDVFEIITGFSHLGMSVNICTNGQLVAKYCNQICDSGATCITVSVDGATAECHDEVRGTPEAYRQVVAGIEAVLKRPFNKRPIVRVRMTISDHNLDQLKSFYLRWADVADDVLVQPVHFCGDAYYTGLDDHTRLSSPQQLESQIQGTPLENSSYLRQLLTSLRQTGSYPDQRCYAGILMARIDPWGNVYPCLEQHSRIGSVRQTDFPTLWQSAGFNRERWRLATRKNCRCWYNNTALIGHYGRLLACSHPRYVFD